VASVPIQKDGMYHIAAVEGGEDVRLSEDYFIEAQKDKPPEVTITRPGRDFKASPIEEVAWRWNAKDDFGLKGVDLHYSVNGGPRRCSAAADRQGRQNRHRVHRDRAGGFQSGARRHGEPVCTAKDARKTTVHRHVLHRNAALREELHAVAGPAAAAPAARATAEPDLRAAEGNHHRYLEPDQGQRRQGHRRRERRVSWLGQSKLRDQANSLSDRMKARQMEEAGESFKSFVADMEQAAGAMQPAAGNSGAKWQDALAPEQKALQYLLRAEATIRDIQVAFGQSGGAGGGMSGATRDMQGLFDLELDTEKNQYEGVRSRLNRPMRASARSMTHCRSSSNWPGASRNWPSSNAAARQTPQQRWEQEMLRREAEKLQQQMQQLAQNAPLSRESQHRTGSSRANQGQQGQQGRHASGFVRAAGATGAAVRRRWGRGKPISACATPHAQQLRQTIDRLQQALQDMRQAASSQQAGTPQGEADARRAADRLQEAQQMLSGLRERPILRPGR
jgi:hypothetical protein